MSDPRLLAGYVSPAPRTERIPSELIWRAERDGLTYHAEVQAVAFVGVYATVFRNGELWTSKRFLSRELALTWLEGKRRGMAKSD